MLYVKNGLVLIERIYRDDNFIIDLLNVLILFWKRVVVLEIFEMRVFRDFLLFVLLSDFFNELILLVFDILLLFVMNVCKL